MKTDKEINEEADKIRQAAANGEVEIPQEKDKYDNQSRLTRSNRKRNRA